MLRLLRSSKSLSSAYCRNIRVLFSTSRIKCSDSLKQQYLTEITPTLLSPSFHLQNTIYNKPSEPTDILEKLVHDKDPTYKAVIFDKDGTLICFHAMWAPWVKVLSAKLCKESGLNVSSQIYDVLGVCSKSKKTGPGLLAEGTKGQIKIALTKMLTKEGMDPVKAKQVVDLNFEDCKTTSEYLKELHDLKKLFSVLKEHGIQIAICTSDTRGGTLKALQNLGILHLIDKVVCGDDVTAMPKPAPHNALMVCDQLGVSPEDTVMVGDTQTDMEFGKNAGLAGQIGVLSGVGRREDLMTGGASMIINSVEDILPILLPDRSIQLTKEAKMISEREWQLVVFDKDGTLTDIHHKWLKWALEVGKRLGDATSAAIKSQFYEVIGVCEETNRIRGGLLAEGTATNLRDCLGHLLVLEGISPVTAEDVIEKVWIDTTKFSDQAQPGVVEALTTLHSRGVKLAINTSDIEQCTMALLDRLGCSHLIDAVITADKIRHQKPLPHGLLTICNQFNIHPKDAVTVGDSRTDMLCGRAAKFGANIAVLSGITTPEYVLPFADVLVPNITYLPQLIRPDREPGSGPGDDSKVNWTRHYDDILETGHRGRRM